MVLHSLAFQGLGSLADPDPLPPPPFFERFFLQDPLPTTIFFLIVAAIGWWWLQRLGKPRESWIVALVCPFLAGGVLLLAKLVITEREALVARATELVNDTIAARATAVSAMLRADATANVAIPMISVKYTRDEIIQAINTDEPRRRGADKATLKWVTGSLDGPNVARTQCRVQVFAASLETWIPTTWMIQWTRENEQSPWKVRSIDAQQIGFSTATGN